MKLFSIFSGLSLVAATERTDALSAIGGACKEITSKIDRTNEWKDCRDCFNLRINFNLGDMINSWTGHVYLSFTEETSLVKIAGAGASVVFDGKDHNDNFRYKVSFLEGHEFGDGRIDVNAGMC